LKNNKDGGRVTADWSRRSFENCHGATWTGVDLPASRWISASVDCRRL